MSSTTPIWQPRYTLTPAIARGLMTIEAARAVVETTPLPPMVEAELRRRARVRSALRLAIEDLLDAGLPPAYTPTVYNQKCSALFEHVYESYPDWSTRPYAQAA